MKKINFLLFFLFLNLSYSFYIQEGDNPQIISNFTFGSNFYGRKTKNVDIFKTILKHNSDLWLWLGNSVSLDKPTFFNSEYYQENNDWSFIKQLYNKVYNNQYYAKLRDKIPIIGTWGEDEYGVLNGDKDNKFKERYKLNFLNFLETDIYDSRIENNNYGIYSSYSFGSGNKTVRFILLDLMYDRNSDYNDENYDMLGEEQWKWLEHLFEKYTETYTFIAMSNQFLSNDRLIMKKWYKNNRIKLFELIGKYKKSGVVLLSGGSGFTQILKTFCPLPNIGYNIYEFTSSGLGYLNKLGAYYNNLYHNDYLIEGTNFNDINFGQIKIHWDEDDDVENSYISMEIYDENDKMISNVEIKYKDLIYREDSSSFYDNENNLEKIKYMNIQDGEKCQRELLYRRVRSPLMIFKYYFTNLRELPIAILTTVIFIILAELVMQKRIFIILILLLISFAIYSGYYIIELMSYNNFVEKIKSIK